MQKTTAKVKHRDYVPYGWIALEFCHVDFYGSHADEMEKKWLEIVYSRYKKYDSIYEENEKKRNIMIDEAYYIYNQVKKIKPFYRFWYNKKEREMIHKANELKSQADQLKEENEKIGKKRFFEVYECHRKIEQFLESNGFTLTSTSQIGGECSTKIEIWTLET